MPDSAPATHVVLAADSEATWINLNSVGGDFRLSFTPLPEGFAYRDSAPAL